MQSAFSSWRNPFSGLIPLLGPQWGTVHCQGPTKIRCNDDRGPDIVVLFPKTVCFAWQEGKESYKAVLFLTPLLSLNADQILTHLIYVTTSHGCLQPAGLGSTGLHLHICFFNISVTHELINLKRKQDCASLFFQVMFFNLLTVISRKALLFPPAPSLYRSRGALFLLKCWRHTSFCLDGCCLSLTTVARTQTSFPPIYNCLFCVIELCIQTGSLAIYIVQQRQ